MTESKTFTYTVETSYNKTLTSIWRVPKSTGNTQEAVAPSQHDSGKNCLPGR